MQMVHIIFVTLAGHSCLQRMTLTFPFFLYSLTLIFYLALVIHKISKRNVSVVYLTLNNSQSHVIKQYNQWHRSDQFLSFLNEFKIVILVQHTILEDLHLISCLLLLDHHVQVRYIFYKKHDCNSKKRVFYYCSRLFQITCSGVPGCSGLLYWCSGLFRVPLISFLQQAFICILPKFLSNIRLQSIFKKMMTNIIRMNLKVYNLRSYIRLLQA